MADTTTRDKRCGNDAPWKVWNPATRDPTLSTALGNPAQDAGFPHSHSVGGEDFILKTEEARATPPPDSS
jgi:hypothetical protein